MTEVAYMVRKDWAQDGTAMAQQSAVIREWVGEPPYFFAVPDATQRHSDLDVATSIAPDSSTRKINRIVEMATLPRQDDPDSAIVVLQPRKTQDLESLATALENEAVSRIFVLVWAQTDIVRNWLDGQGAINLHTGKIHAANPLFVAAAESMVAEEYNGLSTGQGKASVIQLVNAFTAAGYALERDAWLRAYFAAGGSFCHAQEVAKLIGEIQNGTKHRVQRPYVNNIVDVLRDQISNRKASPTARTGESGVGD